jgi:hypothetical protein
MTDGRRGPTILAAMGLLWWTFGAASFQSPLRNALMGVGVIAAIAMVIIIRGGSKIMVKLDRNLFLASVPFDVIGIALACFALITIHLASYILPAIAGIVGLHFVGMSKATERRDYLALATLTCGIAVVAVLLPMQLRIQSTGLAVGATFWFWAIVYRPLPSQPAS